MKLRVPVRFGLRAHPPIGRLRWAVADAWTIAERALLHWVRRPTQVIVACGLLVGWRWHNGLADALAAVALLLLLRFASIWAGIYLGLLLESPEAAVAVQILIWPFGFLSSVLVSPATVPGWLGAIAEWNLLSATASATRELFGNPGWGGDSWIAQHSLLMALVRSLVPIAVFFVLSVQRYRRLSR